MSFELLVDESGSASISLTSDDGDLDTYLRVYDENGNLVAENDDANGSLDSALTMDVDAGVYYISAGSYADSESGFYSVDVEVVADDTGDDGDGDIFADAEEIDLNERGRAQVNDELSNPGEEDTYVFTANREGEMIVTARAKSRGFDTVLIAYDSQGNEVAFNDDWRGTNSRVRFDVVEGETYYVQVQGYGDSTGRYRMNLKTVGARGAQRAAVQENHFARSNNARSAQKQTARTHRDTVDSVMQAEVDWMPIRHDFWI